MKIDFDEMPEELKELYRKYHEFFDVFPDEHAELDGQCPEAFDVKLLKEAIERKKDLPTLVLGENYWNDGVDYGG